MNKRILCIVNLLLVVGIFRANAGELSCGELLGKKLYMQTNSRVLDVQTLLFADTAGRTIYKMSNASAITVAILVEAGYRVVVKSQYRWVLSAIGETGNDRLSSVIISDYLIETIGKVDVARGKEDLSVTMAFVSGGASVYAGREEPVKVRSYIKCGPNDLVSHVLSNYDLGVSAKRVVMQMFVLLPDDKKGADLVKLLENEMDKLKLGMDYPFPQFKVSKDLSCRDTLRSLPHVVLCMRN